MSSDQFRKTTITIEVLSDGENIRKHSLARIVEEMDSGDLLGKWEITKEESLDGVKMAEATIEFGSDPSFFNIDDDGNWLK